MFNFSAVPHCSSRRRDGISGTATATKLSAVHYERSFSPLYLNWWDLNRGYIVQLWLSFGLYHKRLCLFLKVGILCLNIIVLIQQDISVSWPTILWQKPSIVSITSIMVNAVIRSLNRVETRRYRFILLEILKDFAIIQKWQSWSE